MKRAIVGSMLATLMLFTQIPSEQAPGKKPINKAFADQCSHLKGCVARQMCRGYSAREASNYCGGR